jgi:quercetin dioxygenase-like cupin family protein
VSRPSAPPDTPANVTVRAVALFLATFGVVGPVLATPPSNTGLQVANFTLVIDPDATDRVQINLPAASDYEEDAPLSHGTRSPATFLFQVFTSHPKSSTGWHYHPGILLVSVADGSVDWYDDSCVKHVRKAGDFFMEREHELHVVLNSSTVPSRLIITFIIAKGLTYKISAPPPPCAAALGLK